jgi:hypothetical protein
MAARPAPRPASAREVATAKDAQQMTPQRDPRRGRCPDPASGERRAPGRSAHADPAVRGHQWEENMDTNEQPTEAGTAEVPVRLKQGDLRLLETEVATRLLSAAIPARFAYLALDGSPRVLPTWFHWTGELLTMPTFVPRSRGSPRSMRSPPTAISATTRRANTSLRSASPGRGWHGSTFDPPGSACSTSRQGSRAHSAASHEHP